MKRPTVQPRTGRFIVCFALLLVITGLVWHASINQRPSTEATVPHLQRADVRLHGSWFRAWVADTPITRQNGLSGTKNIDPNEAMIFIFKPADTVCFWMKGMHYNLDILWFNAQRELIYEKKNLSPATYPDNYCPPSSAQYVLEVKGGTADQMHVKLGDQIELQQ